MKRKLLFVRDGILGRIVLSALTPFIGVMIGATPYLLYLWGVTTVFSTLSLIPIVVCILLKLGCFSWNKEAYDLISAQFSLPFTPQASFTSVFAHIKQAIKSGGIFTGQFFGIHDEWNRPENDMTFLTREQVADLLSDMKVIEFTEEDKMGNTAVGVLKHWHVFHVIAQRDSGFDK